MISAYFPGYLVLKDSRLFNPYKEAIYSFNLCTSITELIWQTQVSFVALGHTVHWMDPWFYIYMFVFFFGGLLTYMFASFAECRNLAVYLIGLGFFLHFLMVNGFCVFWHIITWYWLQLSPFQSKKTDIHKWFLSAFYFLKCMNLNCERYPYKNVRFLLRIWELRNR